MPQEYRVKRLKSLLHREDGQDLIEYALIAALIALAAVLSMRGLSNSAKGALGTIGDRVTSSV
jgi:pilus assembly protein Flp/PilA